LIVLDASAAVDYLVDAGAHGEWVRDTIQSQVEVAAPHLIDLEVLSSLRKSVARGDVTEEQASDALVDFADLALVRYPATNLMERIWELRSALTPYDAAYVALSEALGGSLITTDLHLARSRGHEAEIVAFPA
jgi:predicted nucleic acid-binding protein